MAKCVRLPFILMAVVLGLIAGANQAHATPIIQLTDFIADGSRTNFNGFEAIPDADFGGFRVYSGGNGPYTEDGISVEQVNGDGASSIITTYFTPELDRGWYPRGGDFGYTKVTRTGNIDFESVGLLRGSGFGTPTLGLYYELYDNAVLVLSGTIVHGEALPAGLYLGWSGGGFDEIRFRDSTTVGVNSLSGFGQNALAIDAIELTGSATVAAVPEPTSLLLLGSGLALGAARARKLRRRK